MFFAHSEYFRKHACQLLALGVDFKSSPKKCTQQPVTPACQLALAPSTSWPSAERGRQLLGSQDECLWGLWEGSKGQGQNMSKCKCSSKQLLPMITIVRTTVSLNNVWCLVFQRHTQTCKIVLFKDQLSTHLIMYLQRTHYTEWNPPSRLSFQQRAKRPSHM